MQIIRARRNERGVAMLLALMALVLVAGIATLMFTRTLNEMRHSADDTVITQTLTLARGGANIASGLLAIDIQVAVAEAVELSATPGRWAFGNDMSGFSDDAPEPRSVARELASTADLLQVRVDALVCGRQFMPTDSMGEVELRIFFTEEACGEHLPETVSMPDGRFVQGPPRTGGSKGIQDYALPFVLVSEATIDDYRRNIVLQGEYQFEIGQMSFAQYAYFTNRDSTTNNQIWFTENTMIDGPTHTNGNFAYYQDPWFGGRVTSAGCQNFNAPRTCQGNPNHGGFFYNDRSYLRPVHEMNPNSNAPNHNNHAPKFTAGVTWNAQYVPLPENAYDQRAVALGTGDMLEQGLIFEHNLDSLTIWGGDNRGNEPEYNRQTKAWSRAADYQYIEACRMGGEWRQTGTRREWDWSRLRYVDVPVYEWIDLEYCDTYRYGPDKLLYKLRDGADMSQPATTNWTLQDKPFNGVVYVEGEVERFRGPERNVSGDGLSAAPAVARFAELTLVTEGDVRLTGDLRYEQPPCSTQPVRNRNRSVTPAECTNLNHPNVLGIYTPEGDIIVGNQVGGSADHSKTAPDDVHIHAVLMSASNQIRVENYDESNNRGQFMLLGGMIQENRGLFGTFSQDWLGRVTRTGFDRVYTYDPRMRRGIAPPYFPTTGLDTVAAVRYFSFGQREQVY